MGAIVPISRSRRTQKRKARTRSRLHDRTCQAAQQAMQHGESVPNSARSEHKAARNNQAQAATHELSINNDQKVIEETA
jgi:hypothetical protein